MKWFGVDDVNSLGLCSVYEVLRPTVLQLASFPFDALCSDLSALDSLPATDRLPLSLSLLRNQLTSSSSSPPPAQQHRAQLTHISWIPAPLLHPTTSPARTYSTSPPQRVLQPLRVGRLVVACTIQIGMILNGMRKYNVGSNKHTTSPPRRRRRRRTFETADSSVPCLSDNACRSSRGWVVKCRRRRKGEL